MRKSWLKKGLVFGIISLFIGTSFVPGISANIEQKNKTVNVNGNQSSLSFTTDWWPMFHHDLGHSGYTTSEGPSTNATELWEYIAGDWVDSSPAVVDEKVYVGSRDHKIYCLNADTGTKIWDYTTDDEVWFSPAVANAKVYIGSRDKKVYCLDADTGTKIWAYATNDNYLLWSSPTVAGGKVYICSSLSGVYCLDADTGAKIWHFADTGVLSSPAVVDGKVYVGAWDNNVYCLNADSGTKIWNYTTGNSVESSPAVVNGKVYVGSDDYKVYCLNAETGLEIWNYTTGDAVTSSPAIANGKIYIGSWDYKVYCLNATNGTMIWVYSTYYPVESSPAIANSMVYIGSDDTYLYCLDANTGAKFWSYSTGKPTCGPAVVNRKVYIGAGDKRVICFGDDTPPSIPNINGPNLVTTNATYEYNISTIDPEGDNVLYYIDWGDGTNTSWIGPYASGVNITVSHEWSEPQYVKQIYSKAKDIYGLKTNWSEPITICIFSLPLTQATLIGVIMRRTDFHPKDQKYEILHFGGLCIGSVKKFSFYGLSNPTIIVIDNMTKKGIYMPSLFNLSGIKFGMILGKFDISMPPIKPPTGNCIKI